MVSLEKSERCLTRSEAGLHILGVDGEDAVTLVQDLVILLQVQLAHGQIVAAVDLGLMPQLSIGKTLIESNYVDSREVFRTCLL